MNRLPNESRQTKSYSIGGVRDIFSDPGKFDTKFPFDETFTSIFHKTAKNGKEIDLSKFSIRPGLRHSDLSPPHMSDYPKVSKMLGWKERRRRKPDSRPRPIYNSDRIMDIIYLDGCLGLELCFEDLPCAVAGISLNRKEDCGDNNLSQVKQESYLSDETKLEDCIPIVKQLQIAELVIIRRDKIVFNKEETRKIIMQQELVSDFRWEKLLVRSVEKILCELGATSMAIQSAENNYWATKSECLPMERSKMRYDVTAKRLGYKLGEDGNFHKKL